MIVEAVPGDVFWSCGLDKEAAAKTDPDYYPGKNILGKILMKIRDELREEIDRDSGFKVVGKPTKRKNSVDSSDAGSDAARVRENGSTPPTVK